MLTLFLAASLLAAPVDSVVLRVLSINDFHGALGSRVLPWSNGRPIGGLAALKGMMDSLEADCGCPTLRFDAGDQLQGSLGSNLMYGRSVVEAMNLLGLDAAAIGNHELDWGADTLAARVAEARYAWLAANVFDSTTGSRPAWARPYAIIDKGPYRIGVVGYLTTATKSIVIERHVRGLEFREAPDAIADALAAVKAAQPDFTVLVAHEGAFCDSLACKGEIVSLARQYDSTAFDLIVAGHTHTLISTIQRGVPIVSARANGTAVGVVDLVQAADGGRRWTVRVETVYADAVRPDSAAGELVARYDAQTGPMARRVVANLASALTTARGVEYTLGNLIADAQREAVGADFALMNNGGIRRSLLAGPVTYSDLFELQPFGNQMLRVRVNGAVVRRMVEHALADGRPDAHLSGMRVRYDPARPQGQRVVEMRTVGGRLVRNDRTYTLAVSDFLFGGGSGYTMFAGLDYQVVDTGALEALVAWFERQPGPVRGPSDKRWILVKR
ncbi:MAG: bifunctional metallophosphatase/5'-nucleotidase [Gemmatimonadales bacterium]|nr:bifunctional metallophosphatase/5'-nucleotidase [Gemmatimonadales bacterium]